MSNNYKKRKPKPKTNRKDENLSIKEVNNDPKWYISTDQLVRDTASFSYAYPVGARLDVGQWGADINKSSVPGIMALRTAITYGYTNEMESPINVAARKMYTYIRHANSGRANYDTPDLMIYLAAMDQAFAYLSWMRRTYGIMSTYNSQNRYFARTATLANGADYETLIGNLADFRAYINTYALKISSMCIPYDIGFINKHMWMYENIYLDKELDKAQTYMYVPDHSQWRKFGLYEDAGALINIFEASISSPQGEDFVWWFTPCEDESWFPDGINKPGSLNWIKQLGKEIIEPILAEQDFAIMSGDILKAYGADKVYKAYGITETYSVLPVYDSLTLDQIQNTTMLGPIAWPDAVNANASYYPVALRQGPSTVAPFLPHGNLISIPKFYHRHGFGVKEYDVGANIWLCDRILTFENNSPTPEQVLEATRMCNIASKYDLHEDLFTVETLGSEVVTCGWIYQFNEGINADNGLTIWTADKPIGPLTVGMTQVIEVSNGNIVSVPDTLVGLQNNHKLVQALSQFSRHPMIAITSGVVDHTLETANYGVVNGMLFEVDNYTFLTKENLKQISEQALLGQLRSYQFG